MTETIYEGKKITLYSSEDHEEKKGLILACGNTHLFLSLESTAELVQALNQNSYKIYQTRNEIFQ